MGASHPEVAREPNGPQVACFAARPHLCIRRSWAPHVNRLRCCAPSGRAAPEAQRVRRYDTPALATRVLALSCASTPMVCPTQSLSHPRTGCSLRSPPQIVDPRHPHIHGCVSSRPPLRDRAKRARWVANVMSVSDNERPEGARRALPTHLARATRAARWREQRASATSKQRARPNGCRSRGLSPGPKADPSRAKPAKLGVQAQGCLRRAPKPTPGSQDKRWFSPGNWCAGRARQHQGRPNGVKVNLFAVATVGSLSVSHNARPVSE